MSDAVDCIRAVRQSSNDALERGDAGAFLASIDSDYVGTAGNGGHVRSRGELRKLIRATLAAPGAPYFVREPQRVVVAASGRRAVETGRWTSYERRSSQASPQITDEGHYTAYWRAAGKDWLIRAELFVALR